MHNKSGLPRRGLPQRPESRVSNLLAHRNSVSWQGGSERPRPGQRHEIPPEVSLSVAKPDPYWAVGYGGEPVLIYPD